MEHQKILNLLNEGNGSKFAAKNGTLLMSIQKRIMRKKMKLLIIQKF